MQVKYNINVFTISLRVFLLINNFTKLLLVHIIKFYFIKYNIIEKSTEIYFKFLYIASTQKLFNFYEIKSIVLGKCVLIPK